MKAIFLDRDGVINKEKEYLYRINDFEFIDGVFPTLKYFQKKGYLLFIITNQSGINRGFYTIDDFIALNRWMIHEFNKMDIQIAEVYFCPHTPEEKCKCRKPKPKMILDAKKEFDLDLENSILIGDKNSDIETGIKAGVHNLFLVTTGHLINENKFNVKIIQNLKELKDLF
jgi:D-glycero-D-manno-heptose 1,7-bisphosphate phosphatase